MAPDPARYLDGSTPVVGAGGGVEGGHVAVSVPEVEYRAIVGEGGGRAIIEAEGAASREGAVVDPQLGSRAAVVLKLVDVSVGGGYVDVAGRVHDCGRLDVGSRVEAPFPGTVGRVDGMEVVVGRSEVDGLSIVGESRLACVDRSACVVPALGAIGGIQGPQAVIMADEKGGLVRRQGGVADCCRS